jgi:hypothetical protein
MTTFRPIRTLVFLFLTATLALTYHPAAAQSPAAGGIPAIAELEGIESAIGRTWSIDYDALTAASPASVDLNDFEGLSALSVQVLHFDSAEHAAAAYAIFEQNMVAGLASMGQGGTPTVDSGEIPELGNAAAATTLVTVTEDTETHLRYVVVHDDTTVLVVTALAGTAENAAAADALAAWIVNDGEVSPDPVTFDPAGFSRGGIWGLLPPSGHDVLGDLIPLRDDQLYPLPQVNA